MTFCPNGHPNPAGLKFCGECGKPLDESDAGNAVAQDPRWYRRRPLLFVGLVLLVGLGVGAALFLVLGGSDEPSAAEQRTCAAYRNFIDDPRAERQPLLDHFRRINEAANATTNDELLKGARLARRTVPAYFELRDRGAPHGDIEARVAYNEKLDRLSAAFDQGLSRIEDECTRLGFD